MFTIIENFMFFRENFILVGTKGLTNKTYRQLHSLESISISNIISEF